MRGLGNAVGVIRFGIQVATKLALAIEQLWVAAAEVSFFEGLIFFDPRLTRRAIRRLRFGQYENPNALPHQITFQVGRGMPDQVVLHRQAQDLPGHQARGQLFADVG